MSFATLAFQTILGRIIFAAVRGSEVNETYASGPLAFVGPFQGPKGP